MVDDSLNNMFGKPADIEATDLVHPFGDVTTSRIEDVELARLPRLHYRRSAVLDQYVGRADSVPLLRRFLPKPANLVVGIGVGRVCIGAVVLAAPARSVRALGLDTATAKRVAFLTRMAATRDLALGAGTLAAGPSPRAVPWLVAGAAADAVDAVAIAAAMRAHSARGLRAAGIVVGAAMAAAAGSWAALAMRRGHC